MEGGLPGRTEVLDQVKSLILDVDGVLFEGQRILPGAVELVSHLRQSGTPHIYLSNNTTYPLAYHVEKLSQLGAPVSPDSIITAARVTAQILANEAGSGALCLVIGEQGLHEALHQAGLKVTEYDYKKAEYVVIGMDRQLTFEKLKCAALAIRQGAQFISSNPDPSYPDGMDIIPASGAVQAALEASTGVRARVTGKPALPGFRLALDRLGTSPQVTGLLGDQLEIDIQGALNAGIWSFLVLSSITPQYHPQNGYPRPAAVFESTFDFYKNWLQRNIT